VLIAGFSCENYRNTNMNSKIWHATFTSVAQCSINCIRENYSFLCELNVIQLFFHAIVQNEKGPFAIRFYDKSVPDVSEPHIFTKFNPLR
jgi:hypothetical protein